MYTHTICVLIFFALCNLSAINCNLCAGRSRRLVSFFVLSLRGVIPETIRGYRQCRRRQEIDGKCYKIDGKCYMAKRYL